MSPLTSFYKYLMENQFPYFHILFCVFFLPTDFGLWFALNIPSNVCNQLVVIITYPEVIKSINRVGP